MNSVIINGEMKETKYEYTHAGKKYYSGKILNFPVIIDEDHIRNGGSIIGELRSHKENGECKMYIYGRKIEDIKRNNTGACITGRIYKKRYISENVAAFTICVLRNNKKRIDIIYGIAYDKEAKLLMDAKLKEEYAFQGKLKIKQMKNKKNVCEFVIKKHEKVK